ncbi:Rap1a/Tai family immunity protein [Rhizosaccharibacter radicis]|uniref:Rap1a immunity protein domain-containing protein n=1 Tax=Rhizosaccharibacter radicis TaxID=2782605 RepID=A0ABT1VY84_9PROT|nr:hypothetical protein [Acetobacteraceae bacterium KSS12]
MIRSLLPAGAAVLLLAAAPGAIAQDKPVGRLTHLQAGKLLSLCQSARTAAVCDAYVSGISDGITLVETAAGPDVARKVCTPAASGNQLRSTVVAWLSKHKERLSEDVGPVVFDAMAETFPCKGGDAGASKP